MVATLRMARHAVAGLVAGAAIWAMAASAALAEGKLNVGADGIAMDGFDVVAYFTEGKPVKGDASHSVTHEGATWIFANAEHAAKFAADPTAYAPKYNGWCAYAMSEGYGAEVDFVNGWSVVDNALYFNWDQGTRTEFLAQQSQRIPKAEANFAKVLAGIDAGSVEFYRHADDATVGISHPQQP